MRRSAAPSQLQAAKRTKFAAPFKVSQASPTTLERNECKSSLQPLQNCNENLLEQELHAGEVQNNKTQRLYRKFLPPSILHNRSPSEVQKIIVEERMASVSHAAPSAEMSDCNVDSRTGHDIAVNISTGEICTEPCAFVISKTEFGLIPQTGIADKLNHCDSSFSSEPVRNPNAGQLKCSYPNLSCNSLDEEDPIEKCLHSHVNMSEMEDKEKLELNYQKANSSVKRFHSPLTKINKSAPQSLLKMNSATSSSQATCQQSAHCSSQDRKDMSTGSVRSCYFSVVWGKLSKKKHKKWEGDGVLLTTGRQAILYDMDGKEIGKGSGYKGSDLESLAEGETLVIGGKEIEVMSKMREEQFKSGKCFSGVESVTQEVCQPRLPNSANGQFKPFTSPTGCLDRTGAVEATFRGQNIAPKFDPCALDALVMPRPSPAHQQLYNKHNVPVVDVVVDPHLSNHLRLHQREGVIFLYECVMGLRNYAGTGAILADDMGLGKTLQCITLIWTLLKQGMYGGKPPVKRVLIISPGSLVKNWCLEFRKWLGAERLKVYGVSGDSRVEEYTKTAVYPVLIISYEMFVRSFETLQNVRFDLVVCDEGHRLKNNAIKTTSFVSKLDSMKRIILSGTPIQNDLQEFFAVVDFCNPGILGTSVAFRRVYEEPIMLSRQPGASIEEAELGRERAAELSRLTRMFVLRRSQEVNNKYLPPKVELVLFCLPSALQVSIYRAILRSSIVRSCLAGRGCSAGVNSGAPHLAAIAALKQLCNHPQLLLPKVLAASGEDTAKGDAHSHSDLFSGLSSLCHNILSPEGVMTEHSGKLATLDVILRNIYAASPHEKVVLVSNHTKTLDLLQQFCTCCGYQHARLDGQTPTAQRQDIVTRFNSTYSQQRIFLLSSKAGGVGLNLIGASRLFLYDIDWNPANDLQAMARIWRDGQKKEVHIYRLLTTGTLEEKIYQRQICKQGLSGAVIDLKASNIQFSQEELLDLFSFREDILCDTHSLLRCPCDGDQDLENVNTLQALNFKQTSRNYHLSMAELLDWQHVRGSSLALQQNWCLQGSENVVSFLFWQRTQPSTR